MSLRGLTIVIATAEPGRWAAALTMACAQAALGTRTRLFLDDAAVVLIGSGDDAAMALDLGVEVILCQAGLDRAGLSMAGLDPRIIAGGMISLLAEIGDDRLVVI